MAQETWYSKDVLDFPRVFVLECLLLIESISSLGEKKPIETGRDQAAAV